MHGIDMSAARRGGLSWKCAAALILTLGLGTVAASAQRAPEALTGIEAPGALPAPTVAEAPATPAPAEAPANSGLPVPPASAIVEADAAEAVPTAEAGTDALREAAAADPAAMSRRMEDTLPHDLSPWGMFVAADWVVKSVMVGLVLASVVTWTIWLAKSVELMVEKRRARRGLMAILQARDIGAAEAALGGEPGPVPLLVRAAAQEMRVSAAALDRAGGAGLKERVTSHLSRIEALAGRRMTRGTGLIATIGSTAPFVGLFGTVWGITNAFIGISKSQTTNLAVVAPGIAEALLATAFGLIAAIPAVVIYNMFARSIAGYRQQLGDASAAVERLVSRDIDYRRLPAVNPAAE